MAVNNSLNVNATTPLDELYGGTGVSGVTVVPTASSFSGWDASSNLSANNMLAALEILSGSGGTTTLTVASKYEQYYTGAAAKVVVLPVTSTFPAIGHSFLIINRSSGGNNITLQSSGGNTLDTIYPGSSAYVTCISLAGTGTSSWEYAIKPALLGPLDNVSFGALASNYRFITYGGFGTFPLSIATAGGTTSLTANDRTLIYLTGTLNQTIVLPGLINAGAGWIYTIVNASTGIITVQSFSTAVITTLSPGMQGLFSGIDGSIDTAAAWFYNKTSINASSEWVQYTPTFTGFGTAASVNIWSRRIGGDLEVRGTFTTGTTTATEARISLGYNGVDGAVTSSSTVISAAIQLAGTLVQAGSATSSFYILIEQNKTYMTLSIQNGTNNGLTKTNGDNFNSAGAMSFIASVPIAGWS